MENNGEAAEKLEPSCVVGENVNGTAIMRTVWRFLKKLKIRLPYDPTIPLLGICLEKTIIRKDACI